MRAAPFTNMGDDMIRGRYASALTLVLLVFWLGLAISLRDCHPPGWGPNDPLNQPHPPRR